MGDKSCCVLPVGVDPAAFYSWGVNPAAFYRWGINPESFYWWGVHPELFLRLRISALELFYEMETIFYFLHNKKGDPVNIFSQKKLEGLKAGQHLIHRVWILVRTAIFVFSPWYNLSNLRKA